MTAINQEFGHRCRTKSDINEHLPLLSSLARGCRLIVEFGVRGGNSTVAMLHGLSRGLPPAHLYSYDIRPNRAILPEPDGVDWVFSQCDTSKLGDIPDCDMLFIDTLHTEDQVRSELRHARRVGSYIALHDTVLFGQNGERGERGIMPAIREFLAEHDEWSILYDCQNNNGMMVLARE